MTIANSLVALAIMVPTAEEAPTTFARSHDTAIQLSLLIGFFALMVVTGLLFSDAHDSTQGRSEFR